MTREERNELRMVAAAAVDLFDRVQVEPQHVVELVDAVEAAESEVAALRERLHKADGMANEINILVREVREVTARAEAAEAREVAARRGLELAEAAMNHMGDALNDLDACEPEDEEATATAFLVVRYLLGRSLPGDDTARARAVLSSPTPSPDSSKEE